VCAMVAAVGGVFYGALQQEITPLDFMWSTSLTLLLLVVLGGRSVINGALLAGALYAVQLLPIPSDVARVLPLAIAIGVIGLAQSPEGTLSLTRRSVDQVMTVLRPLPRRNPLPGPATNGSNGSPRSDPRTSVSQPDLAAGHVR
jgi:hypothetical protein